MKPVIEYTYRGNIEVGTGGPGYRWADGYSETTPEGRICAPWMTYRDCQRDAKARGARAVFNQKHCQISA